MKSLTIEILKNKNIPAKNKIESLVVSYIYRLAITTGIAAIAFAIYQALIRTVL